MKSYKQKFYDNLDIEISAFRNKKLSQSPKEIYDDATRITFYENMDKFLRWENYESQEYKMFLQSDTNFIYKLWLESMKWDDYNFGSCGDASSIVDNYIKSCLTEPVPQM